MAKYYPVVVPEFRSRRESKVPYLSGKEAARHCNGGIFDEISRYTIPKIKYRALLQNFVKLG